MSNLVMIFSLWSAAFVFSSPNLFNGTWYQFSDIGGDDIFLVVALSGTISRCDSRFHLQILEHWIEVDSWSVWMLGFDICIVYIFPT